VSIAFLWEYLSVLPGSLASGNVAPDCTVVMLSYHGWALELAANTVTGEDTRNTVWNEA
jgi:hypothetical protein